MYTYILQDWQDLSEILPLAPQGSTIKDTEAHKGRAHYLGTWEAGGLARTVMCDCEQHHEKYAAC